MLTIGLTGLIGCGKSTVANIFARLGAQIVDTDVIARQLTASGGEAIPLISQKLGEEAINPDGSLNRDLMRKLIFNNPQARVILEEILHPLILRQVKLELQSSREAIEKEANHPSRKLGRKFYNILVVPLLFRSSEYQKLTDRNIFVDCEYKNLLSRLKERNGLTPKEIDQILHEQVRPERQLELADDVIENNGSVEELSDKVVILHKKYINMLPR